MTTTITYEDIFEKCQMLTSFEGGRLTDGSGESLMEVVALTDQDKPLIREYAEQGHSLVSSALKFAIDSTESGDTSFGYTWRVGNSLNVKPHTKKNLIETLSAYCVWMWLENKSKERAESYKGIYERMLTAVARQANKVKPSLT